LGRRWTKRQQGREVTVSLAILNLAKLHLHPRPDPRFGLMLCRKGTLISQPTNLGKSWLLLLISCVSEVCSHIWTLVIIGKITIFGSVCLKVLSIICVLSVGQPQLIAVDKVSFWQWIFASVSRAVCTLQ